MSSASPPPIEVTARERPPERIPERRRKLMFFDRVKVLLLLTLILLFSTWKQRLDIPIMTIGEAMRDQLRAKWWLLVLGGVELVRQVHYFVSERSSRWHLFWTARLVGGWERRKDGWDPWLRYRLARLFKIGVFGLLATFALAALWDVAPIDAFLEAPARIWDGLFSTNARMPFIVQIAFTLLFAVGQFAAIFWFLSRGGVDTYMPDEIKTRFDDVWGQDAVLAKVKENVFYLENPRVIEDKGGHVPGGILLWGPPGTGKTLMAEAVAGETGKPYVFVDPGAFINMFLGVGILKVKSLFRKLRKLALKYGGVIVFFDEADSLGNRGALGQGPTGGASAIVGRDGFATDQYDHIRWLSPAMQERLVRAALAPSVEQDEPPRRWRDRIVMAGMGGGGMGTLQALLTELSGLKKPRGFFNTRVRRWLNMTPKPPLKYRILVMMATNMPQALDEALLRPGRIDRIYKVGYPSKEGRKRTYWGYLDKVSHRLTDAQVEKLATITPYATGATIKDLVNEALINCIREGRDAITWEDIIKAKHLKELGPPEDVEYIERERHATALHEACHAVVAYRVRRHLVIDIATIEKGGTYLGMVSSIPPEDIYTQWRTDYEADIMVGLASLVGERMFFEQDNSSGVSGDLDMATRMAIYMQGYWGMGDTITSVWMRRAAVPNDEKALLRGEFGARVETKLRELAERTERLLEENRLEVLALTHALETYKTLAGEDVIAVIEGRQGPLVDGRPYHTPEFRAAAEAYHELAVAAHRNHSSIGVPLPRLNGHVEAELTPVSALEVHAELPPPPLSAPPFPPPESS